MNTDEMIANLAKQAAPVERQPFGKHLLRLLLLVAVNLVIVTLLYGLRDDIAQKLAEPMFAAEIAINVLVIVALSYIAVSKQFPGRSPNSHYNYGVISLFFIYSVMVFYVALQGEGLDLAEALGHGLECTLCIISYAIIPMVWLLYMSRKLAVTNPATAGAIASLFALSVGALGVRLVEHEVDNISLIVWHYAPLLLLSFIGLWAGKKLFRW